MIDLHCHILPHLDDGARDEQMALRMARIAAADGITDIVATPHTHNHRYVNEPEQVRAAVERLQQQVNDAQIPLCIHAGSEVHVHVEMRDHLEGGRVLALGEQGRYVLVEFGVQVLPPGADEWLGELIAAGYIPLIAHPERNHVIRRDPKRLAGWIERGVLAQVTAGALLGQMGKRSQASAVELVQNSLAHVIASDAHNTGTRRPVLRDAYRELERLTDRETAELFQAQAAAVLRGERCHVRAPYTARRKSRLRWL